MLTNAVSGVFPYAKNSDEELKGLPNARNITSLESANCMLLWTFGDIQGFFFFIFSLVLLIGTDLSLH